MKGKKKKKKNMPLIKMKRWYLLLLGLLVLLCFAFPSSERTIEAEHEKFTPMAHELTKITTVATNELKQDVEEYLEVQVDFEIERPVSREDDSSPDTPVPTSLEKQIDENNTGGGKEDESIEDNAKTELKDNAKDTEVNNNKQKEEVKNTESQNDKPKDEVKKEQNDKPKDKAKGKNKKPRGKGKDASRETKSKEGLLNDLDAPDPLAKNKALNRLFSPAERKWSSIDEFADKLDKLPFHPNRIARYIVYPKTKRELKMAALPDPPPAPTGVEAINMARERGWPDKWKARHRPQLFILGPPKSGTTFMEGCFRWSMSGNSSMLLYPPTNARWPAERGPGKEPITDSGPALRPAKFWNRTGSRRWDAPKELWIYPEMGKFGHSIRGAHQPLRLPPIEEESKNWVLMDSTPDSIMIPQSAQAMVRDLQGAPFTPTFLVMQRDVVSRAYSHYLLFSCSLRPFFKWKPEKVKVFTTRLELQLKTLESIPVCYEMLYEPEKVLKDLNKVTAALLQCLYEPRERDIPMYLPFGFTALGLKYWLTKFPKEQFNFMRIDELKKMDSPEKLWNFFESIFPGMKRMKPRCKKARDWSSPSCTGHLAYNKGMLFCGKDSPALKKEAWTGREGLKFSKGKPEDLTKFEAIGKRWTALYDQMVEEMGRKFYTINENS